MKTRGPGGKPKAVTQVRRVHDLLQGKSLTMPVTVTSHGPNAGQTITFSPMGLDSSAAGRLRFADGVRPYIEKTSPKALRATHTLQVEASKRLVSLMMRYNHGGELSSTELSDLALTMTLRGEWQQAIILARAACDRDKDNYYPFLILTYSLVFANKRRDLSEIEALTGFVSDNPMGFIIEHAILSARVEAMAEAGQRDTDKLDEFRLRARAIAEKARAAEAVPLSFLCEFLETLDGLEETALAQAFLSEQRQYNDAEGNVWMHYPRDSAYCLPLEAGAQKLAQLLPTDDVDGFNRGVVARDETVTQIMRLIAARTFTQAEAQSQAEIIADSNSSEIVSFEEIYWLRFLGLLDGVRQRVVKRMANLVDRTFVAVNRAFYFLIDAGFYRDAIRLGERMYEIKTSREDTETSRKIFLLGVLPVVARAYEKLDRLPRVVEAHRRYFGLVHANPQLNHPTSYYRSLVHFVGACIAIGRAGDAIPELQNGISYYELKDPPSALILQYYVYLCVLQTYFGGTRRAQLFEQGIGAYQSMSRALEGGERFAEVWAQERFLERRPMAGVLLAEVGSDECMLVFAEEAGRFAGDKTFHLRYAEAYMHLRAGVLDKAAKAVAKALELRTKEEAAASKSQILKRERQAAIRLQRRIKKRLAEKSGSKALAPESKPAEAAKPLPPLTFEEVRDILCSSPHFAGVFGTGERVRVRNEALYMEAFGIRGMLGEYSFADLVAGLARESPLIFSREVDQALMNLGIASITAVASSKDVVTIRINFLAPRGGRYSEGEFGQGWDFEVSTMSADMRSLAATRFVTCAVLESILIRLDSAWAEMEMTATALAEEPKAPEPKPAPRPERKAPRPGVVNVGRPRQIPAAVVPPTLRPKAARPTPKHAAAKKAEKPAPAPRPAPSPVPTHTDAERTFFKRIARVLGLLRKEIASRGIDLVSPAERTLEEAFGLADFIRRFRHKAVPTVTKVPLERGDNLDGILGHVFVYGSASAVERLARWGLELKTIAKLELAVPAEAIAEIGFETPSRVFVVFECQAPRRMHIMGVIDLVNGELEILGNSVSEDLRNRLLKIGLECYGSRVCDAIDITRRVRKTPAENRRALIEAWKRRKMTGPDRSIPAATRAFATLDAEDEDFLGRDVPSHTKLLPRLLERARNLALADGGLPEDEPLFTRRVVNGYAVYDEVSDSDAKAALVKGSPFAEIFLRDRRSRIVNLGMIHRKVSEGGEALLPRLPSRPKVKAAQAMGMDISNRPGLFAVVEYDGDRRGVVHRLALIEKPGQPVPEIKLEWPDYDVQALDGGIELRVYPGTPPAMVEALLATGEVQAKLAEWQERIGKGLDPDELRHVPQPGRRRALDGLGITDSYFLVMPIPRTFEDPRYTALSQLAPDAQREVRKQFKI